ncbi:MAG: hypothetical protein AAF492_03895 [Verrucomicrobiota bacterium]
MKIKQLLVSAPVLILFAGCIKVPDNVNTTHRVIVDPTHITLDINVNIQNALKKEFEEKHEIESNISDESATEALEAFLKSQSE